ncbi:MAG TPA: hypothetical protein VGM41_02305, partial [Chitinophagaceae bacterium]
FVDKKKMSPTRIAAETGIIQPYRLKTFFQFLPKQKRPAIPFLLAPTFGCAAAYGNYRKIR